VITIHALQQLEAEKSDLERSVAELKLKCEVIETRENERRAAEERKHADEVTYLKKYTEQLKVQLDAYLISGKKGPPGTAAGASTDSKPAA
jgi:dynein light intermediate chain